MLSLDPENLIACPNCDLLHRLDTPGVGQMLRCTRCRTVLASSRGNAIDSALAAAITTIILICSAVMFPFIRVEAGGLKQSATLIDAVLSFSDGPTAPLVFVIAAFILVLPVARAVALCYTLWPLRFGRPPYRGAAHVFRFANELKPWSMAEIFIIGVAVALVKVVDLFEVSLGPAFWMLSAVVAVLILENRNFCRWTVWRILGRIPKD